ncbi:MAG: alpha/beta hydrolase-fold protein [bacterium]|nr:alpha/beta hydrolase-fold protein [bacterium]
MNLFQIQLYSECLNLELPVWVTLPEREKAEKEGFKTLWLYHGGGGCHTDWLTSTHVQALAEEHGWALVMPTTMDSCFVDMNQGEAFGLFVGKELPERLRELLPCLSRERRHNAVSGFSNGGYGALLAGLRFPEMYGWIAAFAAGDKADADFSYRPLEKLRFFGEGDLHKSPYSTKCLAAELVKTKRPLPKVFHAYGEFDAWREMNEKVRDDFCSYEGNPYAYCNLVVEGKVHEWSMCEIAIQKFMEYYDRESQSFCEKCTEKSG